MAALVILSYTLIRIVVIPPYQTELQLLGLLIGINIDTQFIMLALAASLTAAGADWLIRTHPSAHVDRFSPEHLIVPGLAALAIGGIITRIPENPALWIGLLVGAIILMGTLFAEFIVSDREDPRYDIAAVILRTLAYALLIGMFFAIRSAGQRAIYAVPIIFIATTAVSWRIQQLTGDPHESSILQPLLLGWIAAQIAWGLHYWPLSPLKNALILGLVVYLANGVLEFQRTEELSKGRAIELGIIAVLGLAGVILLA